MRTRRKNRYIRAILLAAAFVGVILVTILLTSFISRGNTKSSSNNSENSEAASIESTYTISINSEPSTKSEPLIIEEVEESGPEYKSLGEFTLTAYCPCVNCCGEWSEEHPSRVGTDYVQLTASGTIPTAGRTIGVDTDVIPFGTTVLINGHEYVAEDRGGAITGNSIDIFFDDHDEALEFGRQTAEVFIKL